ncbi:MAG: Fe-S cluster assembly protein SufD [Chloroflexi bacterium]|nr:Fe-S cluster assembly protein SufD [Chloroflexota bacterium]
MTFATVPAAVEKYSTAFEAAETRKNSESPAWLNSTRRQAWATFSELGIPTRRRGNELWKYTNLRPLAEAEFSFGEAGSVSLDALKSNGPWDDSWDTIVVVDGVYSDSLSNLHGTSGLVAGSLASAISSGSGEVERLLSSLAGREEYAFTALNTAFIDDGAYVQIAEDSSLDSPVQVVFVTSGPGHDGDSSRATYPRLLVDAGENSSLTLIETYINLSGSAQLTVPVVEIFAGRGSVVRHHRVQMENEQSFHIGTTRVNQLADSTFSSTTFAVGASIGRNDIHTQLAEPGAECTLRGLYMTGGQQHQDQEISTTHAKPHCSSHQYYKGILSGRSRAVFSGKVVVERDAQKSIADQKDLNLLLSRGAEIDAKPSLEIYADDVKAAHGATAGHVDRNTLFYLQSRGIDEDAAKAMLVRGFAEEMLDDFKPKALRDFVERVTDYRIKILLDESDTIGTA